MLGLELCQSEIPDAWLRVFTTKRFSTAEVIGQYYGTLVYYSLAVGSSNSPSVYIEHMMAVPVSNFMKWVLQLKFKTRCGRTIWIYRAPFCAMCILNDAGYTPEEPGRQNEAELNESPHLYRRNNVEF